MSSCSSLPHSRRSPLLHHTDTTPPAIAVQSPHHPRTRTPPRPLHDTPPHQAQPHSPQQQLIPPHTPALTHPPRTLFSMSERPASHDHLAMWPRTPRYHTLHTSYHTHEQTLTSLTPSHPCHKRTHIYQNHNQIHQLVYAHRLKRRSHTHRTPNRHAHPDQEVDSTPLHTYTSTTLTIPPNHVPIPPSHKKRTLPYTHSMVMVDSDTLPAPPTHLLFPGPPP